MKRVLILYYSQAGQTQRAVETFVEGLRRSVDCDVRVITSQETFAFPWTMRNFFRAFPRAVRGLAPATVPLNLDWSQYDLLVLGYQVWFLSPSLPIQGFLNSEDARGLRGKKVITLLTCRNLWQSALLRIQVRLQELQSEFLGQITLCELSPVWATFVTTPRWMLSGKQEAFWIFPKAGISNAEFAKLKEKGERIGFSWVSSNFTSVATSELGPNMAEVSLVLMDRIGSAFFSLWARIIAVLAPEAGLKQDLLLILFRATLIALILMVAPCTRIFQFLVGNNPKWLVRFSRIHV